MAYGQYVKNRERRVSGQEAGDDGENRSLSYHQTPATINWKSLMASSARTSRRLGRAKTNLVPQRIGKLDTEEDSTTGTCTTSGETSPRLPRSSRPSTTATTATTTTTTAAKRPPLSPLRTNIDDILARYAPSSPRQPPPSLSPVRMGSSLHHRRKLLSKPDPGSHADLKPVRFSLDRPSGNWRPSRRLQASSSASSLRSVSVAPLEDHSTAPASPHSFENRPRTQSCSPPTFRKTSYASHVPSSAALSPLAEAESNDGEKLNVSFMEDTLPESEKPPAPPPSRGSTKSGPPPTATSSQVPVAVAPPTPATAPNIPGAGRISIGGKCYTVMGSIGTGGSAKVYRGLDEDNKLVAIKRVDVTEASDVEAQGFRNEIHLLQKLKGNPRIVTLYDSEERLEDDGKTKVLYMVMEHGEKDLSRLLKELIATRLSTARENDVRAGLTDAKVKFYWEEMLEAVQVIHREGIVHSDLKPANFLIAGGFLKLIDFGIASAVADDKTHVTKDNLIGTFNFMSPEAIQDQSTDPDEASGPHIKISYKSDVWSLGCILYNLIYGKMPFGEIKNALKKFQAILDPNHKIKFGPVVGNHDPQVVDVLKRCLVRDPNHRASIEELLAHPYLKATKPQTPKATTAPGSKNNLAEVMSMLSTLTPNTRNSLVKNLTNGGGSSG